MIKINFIEILVFTLLILFKFAYCNSDIEAPENGLGGLIDSIRDEEYGNRRGGVWFGPRLGKRSKESVDSDGVVTDDDLVIPLNKMSFDSFQSSPYIIYLLAGKQQNRINKNRYLTPRLGRETVETIEIQRVRPIFAPRLGKKALPFSPRLGRQLFAR